MMSKAGGKKIGFQGIATTPKTDLVVIKELLEAGQVVPVIDRCYPLSETPEAIRYLERGHARDKVVLIVDHHSSS
jgi:NADPH:quinone reductase-like Zn-dependent oxidoreductase